MPGAVPEHAHCLCPRTHSHHKPIECQVLLATPTSAIAKIASSDTSNSGVEDTFNIRGSHSKHPKDDILGDLGKSVVQHLHICVMFDESLLICAHIL